MRTSAKLIRLCAVVPSGLAGSFVAVMGLGFLPDLGLVAALAGTVVVSLVLACGVWEAPVVRVFGFARGLRQGERAALASTLALLKVLDLEPQRVVMRLTDTGGVPATWIGRRTVVVEPTLVQGLYEHRLTREGAAAAIGHAVASQRIGPSRFDLAARLWAFPLTLLYVVIRQIARAFSWVPASGFAWQMRFVIGVIVVVQGFQPGGDPAIGIATGILIAISYVAPAADRYWRRVVERASDRIVALAGLAGSMVDYAQWQDGADSLERVHRISAAADERQRQKQALHEHSEQTAESGQGDALVLTHPTALR
ncbi:hypothetical protein [Nocardioides sp.]|uniref:hypothetical protein n=1 Tax=Nocardioides sp. TaxID=35761 RepID=UPI002735FA58|nr:hypothetical protein [Nocardioides sp.]MDP3892665.1 hypothetical protein [Nocardioides sp.]